MRKSGPQKKCCPFCGSRLLSTESRLPPWGSNMPEETIVCDDCAASAPKYIWDLRHDSSNQLVAS